MIIMNILLLINVYINQILNLKNYETNMRIKKIR